MTTLDHLFDRRTAWARAKTRDDPVEPRSMVRQHVIEPFGRLDMLEPVEGLDCRAAQALEFPDGRL